MDLPTTSQHWEADMSQKRKAAVIGAGIMGTRHSHALHQRPKVDLVAVADLCREVVEDLAQKERAKAYQDYQEMLSKEDLDLVVVATPAPLYREPVVACPEAGVPNIVVENPLATTLADATTMV
jgi:predicted dehydrogenase